MFVCDLAWTPGVTPLITPPPLTPRCQPHEPHPAGYVAHSDWAELMEQTHTQRQCRGCWRWEIWEPKEAQDAQG